MNMMGINAEVLRTSLVDEEYCKYGHASGALYATLLLDLTRFGEEIKSCL